MENFARVLLPILAFGSTGVTADDSAKIDTVVVVMMENRAFDHMLGFMQRGGPFGDERVDGLNGTECNSKDVLAGGACTASPYSSQCGKGAASDPPIGIICVSDDAADKCAYDPNHAHDPTTERIFGCKSNVTPNTPCTEPASTDGKNTMTGFSSSSIWEGKTGLNEMSMWPSEKVPIITTLAKEYALFDRFFCSHPGPTYPNRQFVHSGTAHGETDDEVPKTGFPQKTIYRQLEESGLDWRMYYEDSLAWSIFLDDLRRPEVKDKLEEMSSFYADAASGRLPAYSFIEPRIAAGKNSTGPSFGLANHQHPVASVLEGERLMKNMYEALRNGPKWNSTLFIITYDEHGGFFDHVPPPQEGVPNPDGILTKGGFNYTRLGIRIPTIAISPWIEKGTLVHEAPASQKPDLTSQWELSSIPATVQKLLNLKGPPLTKRTEWAATFEHLFTAREAPRDDCPLTLPELPPPSADELARQLALPIDEHARGVIKMLCDMTEPSAKDVLRGAGGDESQHCVDLGICLPPVGCGAGIVTNEQFSDFRAKRWKQWMEQK